ncbi:MULTISPECIES: hypothetical protein [Serratia]|uniref:hypothetical protein n=1 Tax=Serratia TaxID=613 RepID=UPI00045063F9|nr:MULTISPECIES: hypothetical protein [Serratia]EZQ64345.1 hypothetical protein AF54_01142 [Serratia marcescens BIDMC 81]UMK50888.1 hypothetical protein L2D49_14440 [Serratia ureilytica]BEM58451.1 hypothetical protein SME22J_23120 [Serratia marcescens]
MSLEIISLDIVANTADGRYGVSIPFSKGLFLLRVENSHGKSTCMNAIAYALGMEKALGVGAAKIPFPPSLTRALTTIDGKEISIISSYVLLKIKNNNGIIASLKRNIIGFESDNVISIEETDESGDKKRSGSYFLHREGDTNREMGFYKWLANFLNWDLPLVPNHNGKDSPLYPSVIFPTWYVEQKKGWSSIMATIPTQFGIKEVKKRALEFLMSLDVNENILKRSAIKNNIDEIVYQWKIIRRNAEIVASKVSSVVTGIPEQPELKFDNYKIDLVIKEGDSIRSLVDLRLDYSEELSKINSENIAQVDDEALQLSVVNAVSTKTDEVKLLELELQEISDHKSYINYQILSTKKRLGNLLEDKRKYEDLKKISDSNVFDSTQLLVNECPTCGSHYSDNLLDLSSQENLMTYESSLTFIKEQIKAFEFVLSDCNKQLKFKETEQGRVESKIASLKADISKLKNTNRPSLALQEEYLRHKINLENNIDDIDDAVREITEIRLELDSLHTRYRKLISERKALPERVLSQEDSSKLRYLKSGVVERLKKYNFTSFDAELIGISEDNYLPTREGYDIGFDTSASDGIRIIWGYLISLFSVGQRYQTNHPGVIIFDEPRQQEANKVSFSELLKDAAESTKDCGQIIFATSEDESVLVDALKGYEYTIVSFDKKDGKLIRKL